MCEGGGGRGEGGEGLGKENELSPSLSSNLILQCLQLHLLSTQNDAYTNLNILLQACCKNIAFCDIHVSESR